MDTRDPDLTLAYLPHLDYDLQRFGPASAQAVEAAAALDRVLGPLLDAAAARGATVVALSEYGIGAVSRPVHVNRMLRDAGLLHVHTQDGMEYLDPWTSRAFAVADHQVAHVYVRDQADLAETADRCAKLPGIADVLDAEGKARYGLDHPRSGSWCWWPPPTPGSPTTTGWTPPAPRTSPRTSRSTANPGSTPPSCSSTRPRRPPPNSEP
ncbi:hypothetical protein GCM10029992_26560 [Glycomyces albus]